MLHCWNLTFLCALRQCNLLCICILSMHIRISNKTYFIFCLCNNMKKKICAWIVGIGRSELLPTSIYLLFASNIEGLFCQSNCSRRTNDRTDQSNLLVASNIEGLLWQSKPSARSEQLAGCKYLLLDASNVTKVPDTTLRLYLLPTSIYLQLASNVTEVPDTTLCK